MSEVEVTFPVVMQTSLNDLSKRKAVANVINSSEVTFLCGIETLRDWKRLMSFTEDRLRFDEKDKCVVIDWQGWSWLVHAQINAQ